MSKLKPCPECGSEELSVDSYSGVCISEVVCNDCSYKFQSKAYEENIWKYWNKLERKTIVKEEE